MYQHQLRKWGVSKNMKKVDKEKRLQEIEHGEGSALLGASMKEGSIDQRTWLKLRRHARDKQREEMKKGGKRLIPTPSPTAEGEIPEPHTKVDPKMETASTPGIEGADDRGESSKTSQIGTTSQADTTRSGSELNSEDEGYLKVSKSNESSPNGAALSANISPKQKPVQIPHELISPPSPDPVMRLDPQGCQIDLVIENLQTFFRPQLQELSSQGLSKASSGPKPPDESLHFWHNVKYGIYLLKVSSPSRAWPTLVQAYHTPASSVVAHPIGFVKELFTTLSPVNTKIYPQARSLLLKHLSLAGLEDTNPLTVIIKQLLRDGHTQEFSQRALNCLLEMFSYALGWAHAMTLEIRRVTIAMLRRAGEFEAAVDLAKQLLHVSQQEFGPGSPQARMAATELAHIHVDKGEYDLASKLSMSVVAHSNLTHDFVGPRFHDSRAVYAMEDLADIHARMGQMEPSIVWLEKAAHDAWDLWKHDVATVHIFDKLDPLLRQCGRSDDADWYKQRFVPVC